MGYDVFFSRTDHRPAQGALIVLRLLPYFVPPQSVEEAQAVQKGERAPSVHWNITGRDAQTKQPAFSCSGQSPLDLVHSAAAECKQFYWRVGLHPPLAPEEQAQLQQVGLPIPPDISALVGQLPGPAPENYDPMNFAAEVWAYFDQQGIQDAFLTFQTAMQTADPALRAKMLDWLPEPLIVGPDANGRIAPACGARRTPQGALLGNPCVRGGKPCRHTPSGLCWKRWGLDPFKGTLDLAALGHAPSAVEVAEVEAVEVAAAMEVAVPESIITPPIPKVTTTGKTSKTSKKTLKKPPKKTSSKT